MRTHLIVSAGVLMVGMGLGIGCDERTATNDPPPVVEASVPSDAQSKAIANAPTFAELARSLKDAFPFVSDVQWDRPTKTTPSEIRIKVSSSINTGFNGKKVAEAQRREVIGYARIIVPALLKSKVPWGALYIDGAGVPMEFEREKVRTAAFQTLSDTEISALSNI